MKYKLELKFNDKPECQFCMLSISKMDIDGETQLHCAGLGIRPKCPDKGCRKDCPLVEEVI